MRPGNRTVVEKRGSFPALIEPNGHGGPDKPGEKRAAQKGLQIENEIKLHSSDGANPQNVLGEIPEAAPGLPVKEEEPFQIGVMLQKRSQIDIDPPIDVGMGPRLFDVAQYRQSVDDISQRAGLADKYLGRILHG
jgi:hypothetical protein